MSPAQFSQLLAVLDGIEGALFGLCIIQFMRWILR